MNKKLALGFTAAVAAGAFWACGSGDIIKSNDDDGLAVFVTDSWNGYNVDSAMIYCSMDATCAAEMAAAGPMNPVGETSSESTPGPGPAESASSAYVPPMSAGPIPPFGQSSSSSFKFVTLSSSSNATIPSTPVETSSSSSVIIIPTGGDSDYGTCAPVPSVIELGGSVTWKFTKGPAVTNPIAITTADYAWTFEGGSIPSSAKHGNASSDGVYYNTSGVKNASLVFTMSGGAPVTINCSPLQVNGAPITGCKCVTDAVGTVDYTAAPDVSWSVSGCATATTPQVFAYSWDGGAAGAEATFTKTFAEAQSGWAPTLKVANNDNTVIDVTCPAVKTTKGPEYSFEIEGSQLPTKKIEIADGGCIAVTGTWDSPYDNPSFGVTCDATGNVTLAVSYGTKTESKSGQYGVNGVAVTVGTLKAGAVSYDNICISLTGAETATCSLKR